VILKLMRVRGDSLAPRFHSGDFVLISSLALRLRPPRPADVIVFDHPAYGRLIKRIQRIEPDGRLFVRGDDIDSVDSRRFGPIDITAVKGLVVWHIVGRREQ